MSNRTLPIGGALLSLVLTVSHTQAQTPNDATALPTGLYFNGNLDVGPRRTMNSNHALNKTELSFNNSSTSLIWFKGIRRLGTDTTASFLLELDVNPTQSTTANGAQSGNAFQGTPFQGEQWVALEGPYGLLKLGTPNSGALLADLTAQPFGTALGSGYVASFGRLGTSAISGVNQIDGNTPGRIIRHEKTAMYTTPVFSGVKANVEYAPGNSRNASVSNNSNQYQALSVQYNKGPLNAIYSYTKVSAGGIAAAGAANPGAAPVANALPVGTDIAWNFLAANYTIGPVTVYGGFTTTKHNAPTPLEDSRSWNVAAKYVLTPSIELMGNYVSRNSNLVGVADARSIGGGANFWYDKVTNLYLRVEHVKSNAVGTTAAVQQGIVATGVRYQF